MSTGYGVGQQESPRNLGTSSLRRSLLELLAPRRSALSAPAYPKRMRCSALARAIRSVTANIGLMAGTDMESDDIHEAVSAEVDSEWGRDEGAPSLDGRETISPRSGRTKWIAVGAAVVVIAVFAGGWAVASAFQSPAQRAAAARAPETSVITASVTEGELATTVGTQVTLERRDTQKILVPKGAGTVVTGVPLQRGTSITAGAVVLEMDGRPLIVLPGAFPYYRDLAVGDSGPDVRQLQVGLAAAGLQVDADGNLGAGTADALQSLYTRAGYKSPEQEAREDAQAEAAAQIDATETNDDEQESDSPADAVGGEGAPENAAASKSPEPGDSDVAPSEGNVVVFRSAEVTTTSQLPAHALTVPKIGTLNDEALAIDAEQGEIVASAKMTADSISSLRKGQAARVTTPDGHAVKAAVGSVGKVGDDGEATVQITMQVSTVSEKWLHKTSLAEITVARASGRAMIVPTKAVVTSGPRDAYILKQTGSNTFSRVPVEEIGTLSGRSAIRVIGDARLKVGDEVKVS